MRKEMKVYALRPVSLDQLARRTGKAFSFLVATVAAQNADEARQYAAAQDEAMPVCTENLNPNVLTMKSAQYGARIYDAGSLNLASSMTDAFSRRCNSPHSFSESDAD